MSTDLTPRDLALLEAAEQGLSGQEMQVKFGIPAAQAVMHVKRMLADWDIWTDVERRKMLIHDLYKIKNSLQAYSVKTLDKDTTKNLIETIKLMDDILSKQQLVSEELETKVTESHSRAMLNFINQAMRYATQKIQEDYPNLDPTIIDAAFNEGLRKIQDTDDNG